MTSAGQGRSGRGGQTGGARGAGGGASRSGGGQGSRGGAPAGRGGPGGRPGQGGGRPGGDRGYGGGASDGGGYRGGASGSGRDGGSGSGYGGGAGYGGSGGSSSGSGYGGGGGRGRDGGQGSSGGGYGGSRGGSGYGGGPGAGGGRGRDGGAGYGGASSGSGYGGTRGGETRGRDDRGRDDRARGDDRARTWGDGAGRDDARGAGPRGAGSGARGAGGGSRGASAGARGAAPRGAGPRGAGGGSRGTSSTGGAGGRPARSGGAGIGRPGSSWPARPRVTPDRRPRSTEPQIDVHDPDGVRLQKVLASAGLGSRRACEELITAGRVSVDGQIVVELGVRVDPKTSAIHVDGLRLQLDTSVITLALNKPLGVVSTMHDPEGRPSLAEFVENREERLFHVGRLDADSEGLILLTNDGDLANRLSHPSHGVTKTYLAHVEGRVSPHLGARMRKGVELEDGVVTVDDFRVIDSTASFSLVEVVLHEGRNRVVRRLLDEVGHPVTRLVRTQIGSIKLGDLRPGRTRVLGKAELGSLMTQVGM